MNEEGGDKEKTKPRIIAHKKAGITERRPPPSTPPSRRKEETPKPVVLRLPEESKSKLPPILLVMIICIGAIVAFMVLSPSPPSPVVDNESRNEPTLIPQTPIPPECEKCEINETEYTIVERQHKIDIKKPEFVKSIGVRRVSDDAYFRLKDDTSEYEPKEAGTHITEIKFKNCTNPYCKEWEAVKMPNPTADISRGGRGRIGIRTIKLKNDASLKADFSIRYSHLGPLDPMKPLLSEEVTKEEVNNVTLEADKESDAIVIEGKNLNLESITAYYPDLRLSKRVHIPL